MKNKFYKSIAMLSILTTAMLLNSCNVAEIDDKNGVHEHDKTKNNSEIEGKTDYTNKTEYNHYENCIHEQEATCPWCEGGYRYFYKLSNGSIILMCEECNCIWIDPKNIDLNNAIGEKKLKEKLNINESEDLFNQELSHWATKTDVQKSKWESVLQRNELLIMPIF